MERFYPFVSNGRLTPILRDPVMWSQAYDAFIEQHFQPNFEEIDPGRILTKKNWLPQHFRETLRRFLRPIESVLTASGKLPNVTDAGHLLVAILDEPDVRQALCRINGKSTFELPSPPIVLLDCAKRAEPKLFEDLRDSRCLVGTGRRRWFVDSNRLLKWMSSRHVGAFDAVLLDWIVRVVAALCMIEPQRAPMFSDVLLKVAPQTREWIECVYLSELSESDDAPCDPEYSMEADRIPVRLEISECNSVASTFRAEVASTPECAALVKSANSRSTSAMRLFVSDLEQTTADLKARLREFDRLDVCTNKQLEEIRRFPSVSRCQSSAFLKQECQNLSFEFELANLQGLESQTTCIIDLQEQLNTLMERAGREDDWHVPTDCCSLETIRAALQSRCEVIANELQETARMETEVASFLERLAASADEQRLQLLESASPEFLSSLFVFASSARAISDGDHERLGLASRVYGRLDIAGVVGALLWHEAPDLAKAFIAERAMVHASSDRLGPYMLLAYLSFGQLQELAILSKELASVVAELIIIGTATGNVPGELESLRPLLRPDVLHPVISKFYTACIESYESGVLSDPIQYLVLDNVQPNVDSQADLYAERRERLRRLLVPSPTVKGDKYLQLCDNARLQFLAPLETLIDSSAPAQILQVWKSYGQIDELVDRSIRSLGFGRALSKQPHIIRRFRRLLEDVDASIKDWSQLTRRHDTEPALSAIHLALKNLRHEAVTQSDCLQLCKVLEALRSEHLRAQELPLFVGLRCTDGDQLDDPIERHLVTPTMVHSWKMALENGASPLSAVLLDMILGAIAIGPASPEEAIAFQLERRQFAAARQTAVYYSSPPLNEFLAGHLARLRDAFQQQHADLLKSAADAGPQDLDIATCLDSITAAVDASEFAEANEWIRELEDLLQHYQEKRDPVRLSAIEFLREAGEYVSESEDTKELLKACEKIKADYELYREHIVQLLRDCESKELPESLCNELRLLAQKLDRPSLWLMGDYESLTVADSIAVCLRRLIKRQQDREFDPSGTDTFIACLSCGLLDWLNAGCDSDTSIEDRRRSLEQLNDFAREVKEGSSDQKLLHLLGSSDRIQHEKREPPPPKYLTAQIIEEPRLTETFQVTVSSSHQALDDIRSFLQSQMRQEPSGTDSGYDKLITAVTRRRWSDVRRMAADPVFGDHSSPQRLDDIESLYALALAMTLNADTDADLALKACTAACLGLAIEGKRSYFTLNRDTEEQFILEQVLKAARIHGTEFISKEPTEQLLELLRDLSTSFGHSEMALWISQLFSMAVRLQDDSQRTCSSLLAQCLWNCLTGTKGVGRTRGNLLYLLFRWKRKEALEELCKANAGRHANLVLGCLQSFEHAEANPQAHSRALQLSSAVEEQLAREGQPWKALFTRLQSELLHAAVNSEPVSITAEFREFADDGGLLIDLRIEPSLHDVPNTLSLRVGSENDEAVIIPLLLNEPLIDEISRSVSISRSVVSFDGDNATIAYTLQGTTIRDQRINCGGNLILPAVQLPSPGSHWEPIDMETIQSAWPGADGSPVTRESGFHGREEDIKRIDRFLTAPNRQRSVMVFGQRRIGKTSLLHAIIAGLAPGQGRLCAAFVDLKGMETSDRNRPLSHIFFEYILDFIETDKYNAPLLKELSGLPGFRGVRRMCSDLAKRPSLYAQLEELARLFCEMTNGRVSRIALFLDEFDRFVTPLLESRADEVDTVMWSLRQIAQRSERISLILAGSGLQRLLVDDPKDALFGSVDRVQLKPFRWDTDSEAIRETFLPKHRDVRRRLIANHPDEDTIFREANDICGGHPYYLVLLGKCVAMAAKGGGVTRPLLKQVVDQMTRGQIRSPNMEVGTNLFYYGAFEDLKRLPARQILCAKLLLSFISQQVTTEYPWLLIRVLIDSSDVTRWVSETECYDLLTLLDKEGIIELDRSGGRLRISIPITSKALREDATQIREEVTRTLKTLGG